MLISLAVLMMSSACAGRAYGEERTASASGTTGARSQIKSDEVVVFFATAARQADDGSGWSVPIHGWIYEPESGDLFRAAALAQIRRKFDVDRSGPERERFDRRARLFMVDNEGGKKVDIRLGGETFTLEPSGEHGHFRGVIDVSTTTATRLARDGWLRYEAVTPDGDERVFPGRAQLVEPKGVCVISDVDDTIKHTDTGNREALLANTFVRPFQAVPGMAELYGRWESAGAVFHFVSASPWQLYAPLSEFARDAGFPDGSYHLRTLELDDFLSGTITDDLQDVKQQLIEPIIEGYPQRKFILVGDSGQHDPELYGAAARRYPEQVLRIFIRDVTDEPATSPRYERAFRDVPRKRWTIFRSPETLEDIRSLFTSPHDEHPDTTDRAEADRRPVH